MNQNTKQEEIDTGELLVDYTEIESEEVEQICSCTTPQPFNLSLFRFKWICLRCTGDIRDEKI